MAELTLPKMGESVVEARIIRWLKKPGDRVEADEPDLEIATDKVDSEVPAPVSGILTEIRVAEGQTVPVGTVLAIIAEEGASTSASVAAPAEATPVPAVAAASNGESSAPAGVSSTSAPTRIPARDGDRFYSPLVRTIAESAGLTLEELAKIPGTGMGGRVTKKDLETYLRQRQQAQPPTPTPALTPTSQPTQPPAPTTPLPTSLEASIQYLQEHFILRVSEEVVRTD
jgi:2-oxoglutarate dehydrogenase E2 component (dihydrolipoamide succinyltransferase)